MARDPARRGGTVAFDVPHAREVAQALLPFVKLEEFTGVPDVVDMAVRHEAVQGGVDRGGARVDLRVPRRQRLGQERAHPAHHRRAGAGLRRALLDLLDPERAVQGQRMADGTLLAVRGHDSDPVAGGTQGFRQLADARGVDAIVIGNKYVHRSFP